MSGRPKRERAPRQGLTPGVVKARLLGDQADIDAAAELLGSAVIERSRPYENRDEPGVRVYLTLQTHDSNSPQREQR